MTDAQIERAVDAYIAKNGPLSDDQVDRIALRLGAQPLSDSRESNYLPPPPCRPAPPRAPVAPKPQPVLSGVYFARAGDAIKIGVSIDVRARVRGLSTSSPVPIELLAAMPGGVDEERALHRRFAYLRMNGEWFRAESELLDFIATLPTLLPEDPPARGGRHRTVLTPPQAEALSTAVASAAERREAKSQAWDAALAARRAGVPDEMLCEETGLSRATLNRKYGPRREGEA